jgi:hypothetical protein
MMKVGDKVKSLIDWVDADGRKVQFGGVYEVQQVCSDDCLVVHTPNGGVALYFDEWVLTVDEVNHSRRSF